MTYIATASRVNCSANSRGEYWFKSIRSCDIEIVARRLEWTFYARLVSALIQRSEIRSRKSHES
jgi:hypothetical protein